MWTDSQWERLTDVGCDASIAWEPRFLSLVCVCPNRPKHNFHPEWWQMLKPLGDGLYTSLWFGSSEGIGTFWLSIGTPTASILQFKMDLHTSTSTKRLSWPSVPSRNWLLQVVFWDFDQCPSPQVLELFVYCFRLVLILALEWRPLSISTSERNHLPASNLFEYFYKTRHLRRHRTHCGSINLWERYEEQVPHLVSERLIRLMRSKFLVTI